MEQGRLTVNQFDLESTTYAITASGYVDFRNDESRVPIEVNATKGITGTIGRLPIAGDALQIASVRLVATGSPYDLHVGGASIKDQLIRAGAAAPRSVIKRIGGVLHRPGAKAGETDTPPPETPPDD